MSTNSIIRVAKRDRYVRPILSECVENKTLSWKARGILWYLLSKPDDWEFRMNDLVHMSDNDALKSLQNGLRELSIAGYLHRWKYQDKQGKWKWITFVFEYPQDVLEGQFEYPQANDQVEPQGGFGPWSKRETVTPFSVDGKRLDILNIDLLNKKGNRTNQTDNSLANKRAFEMAELRRKYPCPLCDGHKFLMNEETDQAATCMECLGSGVDPNRPLPGTS